MAGEQPLCIDGVSRGRYAQRMAREDKDWQATAKRAARTAFDFARSKYRQRRSAKVSRLGREADEKSLKKAIKKGQVEYRRTCDRCQTEWYVPATLANQKPGVKGVHAGGILLGGAVRGAMVARMAQERNKTLLDASQCPSCGSSAFQQAPVRI